MSKTDHISWEEMIAHLERESEDQPFARIHLQRCPACRRLEGEVRRLLGALSLAAVSEPSAALRAGTWALLQEEMRDKPVSTGVAQDPRPVPGVMDRASRKLREVLATLVPTAGELAPAVRGTDPAAPHLLVFAAEGYAITLSFPPSAAGDGFDLLGKVVPKTEPHLPAGGRVVLRGAGPERVAGLDVHGGFRFRDARWEKIELEITVGDLLIRLSP